MRCCTWQGPHQVAQKSRTITWPAKSLVTNGRPSRVWSSRVTLEPGAGAPAEAPSRQPKRSRDETKAAVSTDRAERRRDIRVCFIMVSQAYGIAAPARKRWPYPRVNREG